MFDPPLWINQAGLDALHLCSHRTAPFQVLRWSKQRIALWTSLNLQFGCEIVRSTLLKALTLPFLNGNNPSGWCFSFDWFVVPDNFAKIAEGKYDVRFKQNSTNSRLTLGARSASDFDEGEAAKLLRRGH